LHYHHFLLSSPKKSISDKLDVMSEPNRHRTDTAGSTEELLFTVIPQSAPGHRAAQGHELGNSIPLSIFPIATDKFCFCFAGLPGRGKTHIARRLARYLEFFWAVPVGLFNVGEYRRVHCGAINDAEWFDRGNPTAFASRTHCNELALADMVKFLQENQNGVAILDSTNSSKERRNLVHDAVLRTGATITWIEINSDNVKFLADQVTEIAKTSPDYEDVDEEEAKADYRRRQGFYAAMYKPILESDPVEGRRSFFKCDHSKHHFVTHRVRGHLPLKVVHFIMNLRNSSHSFFLSRHGQSEYNAVGRIGGDSGVSKYGLEYAKHLAQFVEDRVTKDADGKEVPARLWTSSMRRTKETAQFIKQKKIVISDEDDPKIEYEWVQMRPREWHHLDELFAGSCDGMTYEEIEEQYPEEFALRQKDKLAYRYPRGESYLDVIARLEPIILEMERHREPLLVIGHQAVLRIVYAFYTGLSRSEAPYVSIPLNTVVEMTPSAFECKVVRHTLYRPSRALRSDGQDEPASKKESLRLALDPPSH
jgi:broad specificity phosphatase PhoE